MDADPALPDDAHRDEALYQAAQIAADLLQRRTEPVAIEPNRHGIDRIFGTEFHELNALDDAALQRRWLKEWNLSQNGGTVKERNHWSGEARKCSTLLIRRGYVRPAHRFEWVKATPLQDDGVIERRDAAKTARKLEEWNEDI